MSNDAIRAVHVRKEFKGKTAVSDLNITVAHGEIYSLLGPNGSGKSTTIKMLVSLIDPTSGEIYIQDKKLTQHATSLRLQLGVALQEASLDETQTGYEFLYLQGRLYGLHKHAIQHRIEELKPLIDIGDALYKQIKTYSGGMKRRLDLAGSIFHKPSILFLDEPTTGLDPISRNAVWKEVQKLNREGMTIFLTTQYLEEADMLAHRVGIMNKGALQVEGTPQQLKQHIGEDVIIATVSSAVDEEFLTALRNITGVLEVRVHESTISLSSKEGSSVISPVAVCFDNKGVELQSLLLRTTTLDDVFLKVTGESFEL